MRGKHYNDLLQRLMKLDDAIVDVGSSNVEDFLKMMQHYADSQEEFDLFVVPVVKDGKQQADTVNTIRALRAIGVPAAKILVLINKVETDDDLRTDFAGVFGFCASGEATIPEGGVIFANELFAMLKTQQLSIGALNDDATDYRQRLRAAANEDEQDAAIQMIAMKRLAKTCNKNLDTRLLHSSQRRSRPRSHFPSQREPENEGSLMGNAMDARSAREALIVEALRGVDTVPHRGRCGRRAPDGQLASVRDCRRRPDCGRHGVLG